MYRHAGIWYRKIGVAHHAHPESLVCEFWLTIRTSPLALELGAEYVDLDTLYANLTSSPCTAR